MLTLTSDLSTQAPVGPQVDLWLVRSVLAVQSCNFRRQLAHIYLCPLKQLRITEGRQLLGEVWFKWEGRGKHRGGPVTGRTRFLGEW